MSNNRTEERIAVKIVDWCKHRKLRKSLAKKVAAAAAFRHSDDDILNDADRKALDELLAAGRELLRKPEHDAAAAWSENCRAVMRRVNPHAGMREFLDILAVALMVAFGIRALFFQPFKIPTSSMQPTLFGIHYIDLDKARAAHGVAPLFGKLGTVGNYLAFAARRAELRLDSPVKMGDELYPESGWGWFDNTAFQAGNRRVTLPGTPAKVAEYAGLYPGRTLSGTVADGYLSDGDHLFVNRLSLHWREPERGDPMVFATEGIVGPGGERPSESGDYYIKRLVGLPGDTLKIVNNVLMVKPEGAADFVPVYELAPNMKKIYSGLGGYQGHSSRIPGVSHFLRRPDEEYKVPPDPYFMLGDNTLFSADSRVWGSVPRKNLVGRPSLVFWPVSRRWGAVDRREPLEVPTGGAGMRTFQSMNLQ